MSFANLKVDKSAGTKTFTIRKVKAEVLELLNHWLPNARC